MPRKDLTGGQISAQAQQDLVSDGIENFELPKSLVTKIAKSAIPDNAKLQKETVLSLVKGSTVFINYLAATAHDVAVSKQHKSISASDVLKALEMIEFGDLVEKLQNELTVYRQLSKSDKTKTTHRPSTSSVSAPPAPGGSTSASASAAGAGTGSTTKGKGKEKEKHVPEPLPPPFTSVPLHRHDAHGAGGIAQQQQQSASAARAVPSGGGGQQTKTAADVVDWEAELGEAADAAAVTSASASITGIENAAVAAGTGAGVTTSGRNMRDEDIEAELEGAVDEAEAEAEMEDIVEDDVGDDDEEEEDGADEEVEDLMEVEEQELRKDGRGLDGMEDVERAS